MIMPTTLASSETPMTVMPAAKPDCHENAISRWTQKTTMNIKETTRPTGPSAQPQTPASALAEILKRTEEPQSKVCEQSESL